MIEENSFQQSNSSASVLKLLLLLNTKIKQSVQ